MQKQGTSCLVVISIPVALIVASCVYGTISPKVKTEKMRHDSDDPAIWINQQDVNRSIIFGTDKETDGAIYAFDLNGQILEDKTLRNLKRPNNTDVEYGFELNGKTIDILAFTEREREMLRIYSIPDMKAIDQGGIPVFAGEPDGDFRAPMGIALYKDPASKVLYAIVSRKSGPVDGTYLWQYKLESKGEFIQAKPVRKFGAFEGQSEIEAVAVDDEAGFIYYSDEGFGIRQYHADPAKGNTEVGVFGTEGFTQDIEGIAILPMETQSTGYIIVSDQQRKAIRIFERNGDHAFVRSVGWKARETDGIEVTPLSFNGKYPGGLLVAMSEGKLFHYYSVDDLLKE